MGNTDYCLTYSLGFRCYFGSFWSKSQGYPLVPCKRESIGFSIPDCTERSVHRGNVCMFHQDSLCNLNCECVNFINERLNNRVLCKPFLLGIEFGIRQMECSHKGWRIKQCGDDRVDGKYGLIKGSGPHIVAVHDSPDIEGISNDKVQRKHDHKGPHFIEQAAQQTVWKEEGVPHQQEHTEQDEQQQNRLQSVAQRAEHQLISLCFCNQDREMGDIQTWPRRLARRRWSESPAFHWWSCPPKATRSAV